MKLQLLDFIKQNKENWKEVLQKPPYSLIVKEDDDYILLKYNQLESDLSNSIVQECRGPFYGLDVYWEIRVSWEE